MQINLLAIALGGSLGALLRYAIAEGTKGWLTAGQNAPFPAFPLGTFIANLVGAFLMGFLYQYFQRVAISEPVRLLLTTGFLGALTTFSTFALEGVNLLRMGQGSTAVAYILLTNLLGMGLLFLGIFLAAGK